MRHLGGLDKQKKKNQAKGAFLYLILLAFVSIDYHKVSLVSILFCYVFSIVCLVFPRFFLVAGSPCIRFQLLLLSWFSRNNCCRLRLRMICFCLSRISRCLNSFFAFLFPKLAPIINNTSCRLIIIVLPIFAMRSPVAAAYM